MTRDADFDGEMQLLGYGASSDAYHMSSPRPDGLGAAQSFQAALDKAGLKAEDISWINLHGTGTQHNDSMESRAVAEVLVATLFALQPSHPPVILWVQPVRSKRVCLVDGQPPIQSGRQTAAPTMGQRT